MLFQDFPYFPDNQPVISMSTILLSIIGSIVVLASMHASMEATLTLKYSYLPMDHDNQPEMHSRDKISNGGKE